MRSNNITVFFCMQFHLFHLYFLQQAYNFFQQKWNSYKKFHFKILWLAGRKCYSKMQYRISLKVLLYIKYLQNSVDLYTTQLYAMFIIYTDQYFALISVTVPEGMVYSKTQIQTRPTKKNKQSAKSN